MAKAIISQIKLSEEQTLFVDKALDGRNILVDACMQDMAIFLKIKSYIIILWVAFGIVQLVTAQILKIVY